MEFLTERSVINIVSIFISLILIAMTFIKWKYSYWKRKGVPYMDGRFPWGSADSIVTQKKSFGQTFRDVYLEMKAKGQMHVGYYFFLMPQYVPIDPELIKHILQKDFQYFVDRGVYYNEKDEPLGAHLFTMEGAKWKTMRAKLTPTFTSGKMKMMFPHVINACNELVEVLAIANDGKGTVEIKDLLARLTTDIIGTCAFGIECNSLRNPEAEFRKYGRLIFEQTTWAQIVSFFAFVVPNWARALRVTFLRYDVNNFFMKVIKETVSYREINNVHRNDFMQLLIQIKNRGKLEDDDSVLRPNTELEPMTVEEIAGQAFVFFLAGFETSSTTMSFCLYELARNNEIQNKLRKEIVSVLKKHDDQVTYEALSEMTYMDMVINETLRKYPPLPVLNRICVKNYKIPNTNIILEKGTQVIISIEGLHTDPEYYRDPDVFDPDRFSDENKSKRHPYTFLPFGEGPRVCVGLRFGLMQTKAGLALLLKNYNFTLSPKTPQPLEIDVKYFLNTAVGGIWLNVSKVDASSSL